MRRVPGNLIAEGSGPGCGEGGQRAHAMSLGLGYRMLGRLEVPARLESLR